MPHSPKRSHLSCWIDADLHASMKERFGHLKSGVGGFVEEACQNAIEERILNSSMKRLWEEIPFKRAAAVISKKAKKYIVPAKDTAESLTRKMGYLRRIVQKPMKPCRANEP